MADQVLEKSELDLALDQEEKALQEAVDQALAQARRAPTRANTSAYDRAKKELDEFRRARQESLLQESILPNIPAVVEYLVAAGYRVGKTKAYDDRDAGLLRGQPDGTFRSQDVDEYAREFLKMADGSRSTERGSLQEQKLREEISRIKHESELKKLKLQTELGELIPRDQVEIELASRAAFLRSDLKNVGRAGVMEIIKKVKGDPQKAAAFVSYWVGMVDEILDRYARPIKVGDDAD